MLVTISPLWRELILFSFTLEWFLWSPKFFTGNCNPTMLFLNKYHNKIYTSEFSWNISSLLAAYSMKGKKIISLLTKPGEIYFAVFLCFITNSRGRKGYQQQNISIYLLAIFLEKKPPKRETHLQSNHEWREDATN